ncbi:MAG: anhydro-N-acetylmuramic acid kinase [Leptolyngbya sp.]|nr:anhydro-N-acetylmuramic acid kinase [Leptolyngbya sp.]
MRVIGLISGTSVDGIDVALVDIEGQGYDLRVDCRHGFTAPYADDLRQRILAVCAGQPLALADLADLDDAIAHQFAQAAQRMIDQFGPVDLVASHGQTVFHRPVQGERLAYSLQLGRGASLARQLGIPTVSNFRQADIEAGGEGAPLVPIVDLCLLSHPQQCRCVQNIGGIGNVTYLPAWDRATSPHPPAILGWDTGPGNSLIDIAITTLSEGSLTYDADGAWAARGTPCPGLIQAWLQDPYLHQPPPKSTGRERFGWEFFQRCYGDAQQRGLSPTDIVATLTQFTAATIAQSYRAFLPALPEAILIGGGGGQNPVLLANLQAEFPEIPIQPTDAAGVPAGEKEAIAFAVLGYWRWHDFPGNLPAVTGARTATLIGICHTP